MDINNMTRRQFESLPHRKWDEEIVCDSIIVLPSEIHILDVLFYKIRVGLSRAIPSIFRRPEVYDIRGMHDSGYRAMDFVAVVNGEAICLLSGHSDVIHFDGIGGYGKDWIQIYHTVPNLIPPSGWSIDCLPTSGLLRIFNRGKVCVGMGLSSFEIFTEDK